MGPPFGFWANQARACIYDWIRVLRQPRFSLPPPLYPEKFRAERSAKPGPVQRWLWTAIGDQWPDDVRLSDLEPRFTCQACGRRGADVRPDWQSAEEYA